jgi:predicted extracellular nuclease
MTPQPTPALRLKGTFHCLLIVSDWQSIIEDLEQDMRRLQSQAPESRDKTTLEAMGAFRRILAAARVSIANNERQMLLATGMATRRIVGRQVR